jgi:nitrate reductase gamma subunit
MKSSIIKESTKRPKAQALLETALVVLVALLFLLGIIRIWGWFNRSLIQRQTWYNQSRLAAGQNQEVEIPAQERLRIFREQEGI